MTTRTRRLARPLVALALAAATLAVGAGCGASDEPLPDVPDGAVPLTVNQPRAVEGVTLVASAIDDTGADISGTDGTGVATGAWTAVGDSVEVYGVTLRLVATWVDADPGDGDGADTSKAWIVVEQ